MSKDAKPSKVDLFLHELMALLETEKSPAELMQATGASNSKVHRALTQLVRQRLVRQVKTGPQAKYLKASEATAVPDNSSSEALHAVTLDLSSEWAHALQNRLELFSRLAIGQWLEIVNEAKFDNLFEDLPSEKIEQMEALLGVLKQDQLRFTAHASWGIFAKQANPRALGVWAIARAIRHRLAWDRSPSGGLGVDFDEPLSAETAMDVKVTSVQGEGQANRLRIELSAFRVQQVLQALDCVHAISVGDFAVLLDVDRLMPQPREESTAPDAIPLLQSLSQLVRGHERGRGELHARELRIVLNEAISLLQDALASGGSRKSLLIQSGEFSKGSGDRGSATKWRVMTGTAPRPVSLEDLPEGFAIAPFKQGFKILGRAKAERTGWVELGQSHSLQTAVLKARKMAQPEPGRTPTAGEF